MTTNDWTIRCRVLIVLKRKLKAIVDGATPGTPSLAACLLAALLTFNAPAVAPLHSRGFGQAGSWVQERVLDIDQMEEAGVD